MRNENKVGFNMCMLEIVSRKDAKTFYLLRLGDFAWAINFNLFL